MVEMVTQYLEMEVSNVIWEMSEESNSWDQRAQLGLIIDNMFLLLNINIKYPSCFRIKRLRDANARIC